MAFVEVDFAAVEAEGGDDGGWVGVEGAVVGEDGDEFGVFGGAGVGRDAFVDGEGDGVADAPGVVGAVGVVAEDGFVYAVFDDFGFFYVIGFLGSDAAGEAEGVIGKV